MGGVGECHDLIRRDLVKSVEKLCTRVMGIAYGVESEGILRRWTEDRQSKLHHRKFSQAEQGDLKQRCEKYNREISGLGY